MDSDLAKSAASVARRIQESVREFALPPAEVMPAADQPVLPHSLFANTRGYMEKVVYQINRTYGATCYDACAVMIRRLVEVLIIEAFEHNNIAGKIKNKDGDYLFLDDLIDRTLAEPWSLGRIAKRGLKKLKTIGDQSAHSRRYNARRQYIDDVIIELRAVSEEFLYIAGLKK